MFTEYKEITERGVQVLTSMVQIQKEYAQKFLDLGKEFSLAQTKAVKDAIMPK